MTAAATTREKTNIEWVLKGVVAGFFSFSFSFSFFYMFIEKKKDD